MSCIEISRKTTAVDQIKMTRTAFLLKNFLTYSINRKKFKDIYTYFTAIQWGYKIDCVIANYNNIDNTHNLPTKFRGLEPINPQGKTSKQLTLQKFRGKNPI